jgi:hypothetical protein
VDEREWLTCPDAGRLLDGVDAGASRRKLRLAAAAFCRGVWHLLPGDASRRAVEAAERWADGELEGGPEEVRQAAEREGQAAAAASEARFPNSGTLLGLMELAVAGKFTRQQMAWYDAIPKETDDAGRPSHSTPRGPDHAAGVAAGAAVAALHRETNWAARDALRRAQEAAWDALDSDVPPALADRVRCLFANPFRSAPFSPSWRTAEVLRLAGAIYAERAFDRLPILADLLEEAGTTDAALLAHLRGPGPHTLGCHALDAALGKG